MLIDTEIKGRKVKAAVHAGRNGYLWMLERKDWPPEAWDLKTGKLAWVHNFPTFIWGPLLTTGGNLVFTGGTNDRMFRAFHASNGKLLWETATPS